MMIIKQLWRLLSCLPEVYQKMLKFIFRKSYIYTLSEEYICPYLIDSPDVDYDWVKVVSGKMTIKAKYTWNGNSPKRNILDLKIIGTPEGVIDYCTGKPKTYYMSLCHDARYQYNIGTKKQADNVYLKMGYDIEFVLTDLYYWFINKFGQKAWDGD